MGTGGGKKGPALGGVIDAPVSRYLSIVDVANSGCLEQGSDIIRQK